MADIFLISGGCRSGKSRFAENLAQQLNAEYIKQKSNINTTKIKAYIATAVVFDAEMKQRVHLHQQQRAQDNWTTFEEQLDLAGALKKCHENNFKIVLVDCLTLWLNNLMYSFEQQNKIISENDLNELTQQLMIQCAQLPDDIKIIFVINEVGMGIIPENNVARLFRDLSGRCSQAIAQKADHVFFISCGLPMQLKGNFQCNF